MVGLEISLEGPSHGPPPVTTMDDYDQDYAEPFAPGGEEQTMGGVSPSFSVDLAAPASPRPSSPPGRTWRSGRQPDPRFQQAVGGFGGNGRQPDPRFQQAVGGFGGRQPDPRFQQAVGGPLGGEVSATSLGLKLLAVAAGAGAGYYFGGVPGAGAGLLFGAAAAGATSAVQKYRTGTQDDLARNHLIGAAVAAGAGGLIWWNFVPKEPRGSRQFLRANPESDEDEPDALEPCDIRKVGP